MTTMAGRLFVFAGGGTGGHLAPGLAVAAELRRREPDCRIRFVGSGRPIEQQMLADTGYEIVAHNVQPLIQLRRRPIRMLRSHWKAYQTERASIRSDRPTAVIGLGGYASFPTAMAAKKEGVPVLLLEQNAIAGRATRLLARWFPVCVTFEESRSSLPRAATAHVTGNPLRPELSLSPSSDRNSDDSKRTLLVLGGSQGSRQINDAVLAAASRLAGSTMSGWRVIHQTGPDDAARVQDEYERLQIEHRVAGFFPKMAELYATADLCVARAGATSLTELAIAGVPSLLIPYPFAADNHQAANAAVFESAGAAIVIDPREDWEELASFPDMLSLLLTDAAKRDAMTLAMTSLARPEAASAVADLL